MLDLAEKHYENLVKALTNNAIDDVAVVASSSSNPTLSLAQSSSIFTSLSNRSDIYRTEEPEIYDADDDNKGDIAN
ncbi:MAG TPA: hypothetical protein VKA91_00050 [Nitrososphaeraceae archaeon]|nr:hypothetical protein [Nitrososphaeraceae archaeon]